eukprot:Skav229149  [mRNA]  locus=scaffold2275:36586:36789:- [translate_table: standard]
MAAAADCSCQVDQIRKKLTELVDSEEVIYRITKPWKKARRGAGRSGGGGWMDDHLVPVAQLGGDGGW